MPPLSPSYKLCGHKLTKRSQLRVNYLTDMKALRRKLPSDVEILEFVDPRYPSDFALAKVYLQWTQTEGTGLGSYSHCTQYAHVLYGGQPAVFEIQGFADLSAVITFGREVLGKPSKCALPKLAVDHDSLMGTLNYGRCRVATASMQFKHVEMEVEEAERKICTPVLTTKLIPPCHQQGVCVAELVEMKMTQVKVHGAWTGNCCLDLTPHVNCPVGDLPVRHIINGEHFLADMHEGEGRVLVDYLANTEARHPI